MNRIAAALAATHDALARASVRSALVGGLAVSVRTEPRFTRDVDLAVAVSDDREAEAVVRHLIDASYRVLAVVEQEGGASPPCG